MTKRIFRRRYFIDSRRNIYSIPVKWANQVINHGKMDLREISEHMYNRIARKRQKGMQ